MYFASFGSSLFGIELRVSDSRFKFILPLYFWECDSFVSIYLFAFRLEVIIVLPLFILYTVSFFQTGFCRFSRAIQVKIDSFGPVSLITVWRVQCTLLLTNQSVLLLLVLKLLTVGSKIILVLSIILANLLLFDYEFLSSHACYKQYIV